MISDLEFRISDLGPLAMTALLTLVLGLAIMGLFFALVVGCDRL
jgi:hypothetical protein